MLHPLPLRRKAVVLMNAGRHVEVLSSHWEISAVDRKIAAAPLFASQHVWDSSWVYCVAGAGFVHLSVAGWADNASLFLTTAALAAEQVQGAAEMGRGS